jgi:hypothetical protein
MMFNSQELQRLNASVGIVLGILGQQKRFTDPEFTAYADLQVKIGCLIEQVERFERTELTEDPIAGTE